MQKKWDKTVEERVLRFFGKKEMRPGQGEMIAHALAGRNALAVLPTGHGKSLCYQAAAWVHGGTSVVVSPLLALMREQVERLREMGIRAYRFDSTLSESERRSVLQELGEGKDCLLYVAPESLENRALGEVLDSVKLSYFVVDEAHCLSQWGHSFRPDYLRLPAWAARHSFFSVLAFTATATPQVQQDLCRAFAISPSCVVSVSPFRSNLCRRVCVVQDIEGSVVKYLEQPEHRPAILYARTRKDTESLAEHLVHAGLNAACYHAGLPPENRERLHEKFLENQTDILVATIAFGMGVDKPDVRSVIHVNLPSSPEAYLQESGRAGRDGFPAESLVFLSGRDRVEARNRIRAAEPDEEGLLRCVRSLLVADESLISLRELSMRCDVAEDVPQRVLSDLVQMGAVQVFGEGFRLYKVRPLFPLSTILSGRQDDECSRLRWLDEHREGEIENAAAAWDCSCSEALEQLRECEAAGEWSLQLQRRAVCLCPGVCAIPAREAAEQIRSFYTQRTQQDLRRLEILEQMLCASTCLNSSLQAYLTGAPLPHPCGICSSCLDDVPVLPEFPDERETLPQASELPDFERDGQRRRFLAGCISPWLLSHRLYSHAAFGCCRYTPWDEL